MPKSKDADKIVGDPQVAAPHNLLRLGIYFLVKLNPRQCGLLVMFVAVSVCAAFLEVASGAALAFLATLLGPEGPQGNLGRLTQVFFLGIGSAGSSRWVWGAFLCAAVLLAANAFQILAFFLRTQTSFAALRRAREILVEYYFSRELGFYSKSHSSEAIAAILTESQRLYHSVLSPAVALVHAGMVALVVAASAVWIKPLAGLTAGIVFIIAYSLYYFALRPVFYRSDRISSGASRERQRILQQGFEGMKEFLFWGRRSLLLDDFRRIDNRATRGEAISLFFSHIPRNVLEILIILSALACGFFAPRGSLGQISLGEVVFYGFAMLRLLPAMQQIFSSLAQLQMGRSALEPVLLAAQAVRRVPASLKSARVIPAPLSEFGLVNVSFRYEEARGWALRSANLRIPVGCLVALVGPTGSGKSTAADLLAGLLDPQEGNLTSDGNSVTPENYPYWRRYMAYLPQHFYILDAPVEENLAFCAPHLPLDRPRLEEAARGAQVDEFIRSLPMGYQEPLGERGVRLSGGQRQRLGIARVLYSQAPILLLDEPTSALDPKTEEGILEAIRALRGSHTIILITHREAAWKKCDMVYRFEKGKVHVDADAQLSRPLSAF